MSERAERREEIKLWLEYAKRVVSILGAGAILIAAMQWRTANQNAAQAVYQHMAEQWSDHLKVFIDKPALRPYFADATALPDSAADRQIVLAVADVRLDVMDAILTYAAIQEASNEIEGWKTTFAQAFKSSPVLCERIARTSNQYGLIVPIAQQACKG